jgi:hypothetical protein
VTGSTISDHRTTDIDSREHGRQAELRLREEGIRVSSIDITMTGAAGAAPTPAVVVCPSAGAVVGGAARMVRPIAPQGGTGLSVTGTTLRPWSPSYDVLDGTDGGAVIRRSALSVLRSDAPTAHRTTSSTPGDLPPRDPLG